MDGGGALMNQGIHTVDLLLWLLGDVAAVQAQMKSALHKIESEDTLIALLEFANGTMGTFIATTSVYPGYPRRVELSGTEGTVILENDRVSSSRPEDTAFTTDHHRGSRQKPQRFFAAHQRHPRTQSGNGRFYSRHRNGIHSSVRWPGRKAQRGISGGDL